jgi:hypothetical protein
LLWVIESHVDAQLIPLQLVDFHPMEFAVIEELVRRHLADAAGRSIVPTGVARSFYLDIAERIVRRLVPFIRSDGRVEEPTGGGGYHYNSRMALAICQLVQQGRCADLLEQGLRVLEVALEDFVGKRTEDARTCGEFYPRDLALALACIQDRLAPEQRKQWADRLGSYRTETHYTNPEVRQVNSGMYLLTGEQMLTALGLRHEEDFVDDLLAQQAAQFNELGMYRDPNCPMTYDFAVRQNAVMLLTFGRYQGRFRQALEEHLRRGALTQLFTQSVLGEAPFGGRSNQFHHVEGMLCCTAEFAAGQYRAAGMPALAQVMKRAARLAALSTARWQLRQPEYYHLKNMFPWSSRHGCESYAGVAVYALLSANLFALAASLADDTIGEAVAPCESGGFVLELPGEFHRIFAAAAGISVQLDTAGQPGYDPTGLGRIHARGLAAEHVLSCGFVAEPSYAGAESAKGLAAAIGAVWADGAQSLAAAKPRATRLEIEAQHPNHVRFAVHYEIENDGQSLPLVETCDLQPNRFRLAVFCPGRPASISIPLLLTNGRDVSRICQGECKVQVEYGGAAYEVRSDPDHPAIWRRLNLRLPNRNGIYDLLRIDSETERLELEWSFAP